MTQSSGPSALDLLDLDVDVRLAEVWRQPDDQMRQGIREMLACNAYAVSEFDP